MVSFSSIYKFVQNYRTLFLFSLHDTKFQNILFSKTISRIYVLGWQLSSRCFSKFSPAFFSVMFLNFPLNLVSIRKNTIVLITQLESYKYFFSKNSNLLFDTKTPELSCQPKRLSNEGVWPIFKKRIFNYPIFDEVVSPQSKLNWLSIQDTSRMQLVQYMLIGCAFKVVNYKSEY